MRTITLFVALSLFSPVLGGDYSIRLRRFVNDQPTTLNTSYIGSTIDLRLEGHFLLPLDSFLIGIAIGINPLAALVQRHAEFSMEVLSQSPEYQRIEFNPCSDPLNVPQCRLKAAIIVDFEAPFESRKLPAVPSPNWVELFRFQLVISTETTVSLNPSEREFTINGGIAAFPAPDIHEFFSTLFVTGFVRGDSNADGRVGISDAVRTIYFLFVDPSLYAIPCLDLADADDDGMVDMGDVLRTLFFIFGEATIPAPFSNPGADPTQDLLPCS